MSKWTLEKILACDEIKFGTVLFINGVHLIVTSKGKYGFRFIDEEECGDGYDEQGILSQGISFQFFRPNGTEILPPKDKKKVKSTIFVNLYPHGLGSTAFRSKEAATKNGGDQAIDCIEFTHEYEIYDE